MPLWCWTERKNMRNEIDSKCLENMQNRKRNICHWRLAIGQMKQYPLLLGFTLPIIVMTVIIWLKMNDVIAILNIPKIILPVYSAIAKLIGILIPILLVWGLIDIMGTLTARKDELAIQMAFKETELRNGNPILMYKRNDKKSGVIVREWYSPIPMKLWIARQEEIADAMNIHFVEKFRYGGNSDGNRIVMCSAKGRGTLVKESPIYDKDLEKDMETIV